MTKSKTVPSGQARKQAAAQHYWPHLRKERQQQHMVVAAATHP
jgi:hypothetical protein